MSAPEWPKYNVGPKDHLYALGVISMNFNLYEFSLVIFLEEYYPKDVAEYLSHKLSNQDRSHLIRLMINHGNDQSVIDAVEYLLRHFAICCENRNHLLHARPGIPILGTKEDMLNLEKVARGDPHKLLAFSLGIGDLRRVGDEMHAGFNYVIDMWRYFFDRKHYFTVLREMEKQGLPPPPDSVHPTLPKTPPEPRKISPISWEGAG